MRAGGNWEAFRFVLYALAVEVQAKVTVWHLHVATQSIATSQTGPLDFVPSLPRLVIASDAIFRFFICFYLNKKKKEKKKSLLI